MPLVTTILCDDNSKNDNLIYKSPDSNSSSNSNSMYRDSPDSNISSNGYITADDDYDKKNEDNIKDKIKLDGFDGAVTMRLIDVDKERIYTPGNISSYPLQYRTFSGYYYRTWANYSTPGYYTTTKTYNIEINVFSIKDDKIIRTGLTETTDPSGVEKMTADVVKTVFKKMKKDGFISDN
jgi:hypothetical protein